jgi:RNA polymerase sigma factor (sigma-70 family)
MNSDSELISSLVSGDGDALAELIRRYVGLVYSAAVRQVGGDAHLAEDVAQEVFSRLVRQAASLRGRTSVGGWLYTTTHHIAANVVRGEQRRRRRETEAQIMLSDDATSDARSDWELLEPVLDRVMHEIGERDRDTIRLRYFERLPVAEVGARLGVTENAAAKRIERSLEKLRERFTRRGLTSSALALAAALEGQSSVTVPGGLADSVTASAASGLSTGLGVFSIMSATNVSFCLVAAAALLGTGAALIEGKARGLQVEVAASATRQEAFATKLFGLTERMEGAMRRIQMAETENKSLLEEADVLVTAGTVSEAVSMDLVSARFKRAQELVYSGGDDATALRELVWCYSIGMPRLRRFGPVRSTSLSLFRQLGERYPPAVSALRELREKALARVQASDTDQEAFSELATINRELKEDQENLALLDQFPKGDRRRRVLARVSYDALLAAQRYSEAVEGMPYSMVSAMFEQMLPNQPVRAGNYSEEGRNKDSSFFISSTTKYIEMLAGAGDVSNARKLAGRLLDYDNSEPTRTLIQRHAARAGHPTLLADLLSP